MVDPSAAAIRPGPSESSMHGEVLNAEEVAAFLGVDRKTVYDGAGRGTIPHQRLGKRLLFSRQALMTWLGTCKAAPHTTGGR
jgi:excisionase family DNA binding protein